MDFLATKHLRITGEAANSTVNFNHAVIHQVGKPLAATDAATKQYVDDKSAGLSVKKPVVLTSTEADASQFDAAAIDKTAHTLTGSMSVLTLDSTEVKLDERVLLKDCTDKSRNGIYKVTTPGNADTPWVLTREQDMLTADDIAGAFCYATAGTVNINEAFVAVITFSGFILDESEIDWNPFHTGNQTLPNAGYGLVALPDQATITSYEVNPKADFKWLESSHNFQSMAGFSVEVDAVVSATAGVSPDIVLTTFSADASKPPGRVVQKAPELLARADAMLWTPTPQANINDFAREIRMQKRNICSLYPSRDPAGSSYEGSPYLTVDTSLLIASLSDSNIKADRTHTVRAQIRSVFVAVYDGNPCFSADFDSFFVINGSTIIESNCPGESTTYTDNKLTNALAMPIDNTPTYLLTKLKVIDGTIYCNLAYGSVIDTESDNGKELASLLKQQFNVNSTITLLSMSN